MTLSKSVEPPRDNPAFEMFHQIRAAPLKEAIVAISALAIAAVIIAVVTTTANRQFWHENERLTRELANSLVSCLVGEFHDPFGVVVSSGDLPESARFVGSIRCYDERILIQEVARSWADGRAAQGGGGR